MCKSDRLYINGVNAITGEYIVPPLSFDQAASYAIDEHQDKKSLSVLRNIWDRISRPHLGLPIDVNPEIIEEAGWGIIFHKDESAEVKSALEPLIEHRRKKINNDSKIKILEYRPGEDRTKWLARHAVGAGSVEPTKVPYYLLLVGNPKDIPFSFCHHLDVDYAVGWLHLDFVSQYDRYVQSVIDYETCGSVLNTKEAVFFGTRHSFDRATQMSADLLVNPLADGCKDKVTETTNAGVAQRWGFRSRKITEDEATKSALLKIFSPAANLKPPALLFTATHGMGLPSGHPRQLAEQGALLCQDWPGIGTISSDHYFAASDLPDDSRLHGLISFHFACYGAGTPSRDRFIHEPGQPPPVIAEQPFLANLPKALLSHPAGGALACIGHVERAWGYSIVSPNAGAQLLPFQNALGRILLGQPVGHALKDFNERYASLSVTLSSKLEEISFGAKVPDYDLATNWIERNDAEGYIVIGDPAVHLRAGELE